MLKELTEKMVAAFTAEDETTAIKFLKQIAIELDAAPKIGEIPIISKDIFDLLSENEMVRGAAFYSFVAVTLGALTEE